MQQQEEGPSGGGIAGDACGMEKTIQTLATLAMKSTPSIEGTGNPHLGHILVDVNRLLNHLKPKTRQS